MFYLPSKVKNKYIIITGIVIAQLAFMRYAHQHNLYSDIPNLKILDDSMLPSVYKALVSKISPSTFMRFSMADRCSTYFDGLSTLDEHWEISDLAGMDYSIDVLSSHAYYENKYNQLKQQFQREGRNIDDIDTREIMTDLNAKLSRNAVIEKKLADSVSHLRVYGTCYISNDEIDGYSNCYNVESRLFPWLTFESPLFERWDGTFVNDYPQMSDYYTYEHQGEPGTQGYQFGSCILTGLKHRFNGRGIVLSIDDHLVDEAVKLIKTLRYLKNELPIQFVHKGDLNEESKQKLIDVARLNVVVQNAGTIDNYKQEIWFVNVTRCLRETHFHKFYMYRNKWLAVLFNSFEEMILMDTDVVTFLAPNQYFKFQGYKKTKAFFFRDRETGQQSNEVADGLLLKLMPKELEQLFFNIPGATNYTLGNKFFQDRAFHYMESGVVVMNRKDHLLGLLISTQLQFWAPISAHTHGDKELFWLGQSFAGDENYYFNPNPAGAVGRIDKKQYAVSDVIVGAQPAHVGPDNETLLWINSGMETCKKHSWEHDFKNKLKISEGFSSEEMLKRYYLSPLDIEGVIVPPDAAKSFPNSQREPERGWKQLEFDGCDGYLWGGYSKVGGNEAKGEDSKGLEIRFDAESIALFREVGHIWVNKDYYYEPEKPPTLSMLNKYWLILEKFRSVQEYENRLNEGKKENDIKEKWDSTDSLKFLVEEGKEETPLANNEALANNEGAKSEELRNEGGKPEEPIPEEPNAEKSKVEEPIIEEHKAEEPKAEDPKPEGQ